MKKKKLTDRLREYAIWGDANIWDIPETLPDDLRAAADIIDHLKIGTWIFGKVVKWSRPRSAKPSVPKGRGFKSHLYLQ